MHTINELEVIAEKIITEQLTVKQGFKDLTTAEQQWIILYALASQEPLEKMQALLDR